VDKQHNANLNSFITAPEEEEENEKKYIYIFFVFSLIL
jgi:hypothetical protein